MVSDASLVIEVDGFASAAKPVTGTPKLLIPKIPNANTIFFISHSSFVY